MGNNYSKSLIIAWFLSMQKPSPWYISWYYKFSTMAFLVCLYVTKETFRGFIYSWCNWFMKIKTSRIEPDLRYNVLVCVCYRVSRTRSGSLHVHVCGLATLMRAEPSQSLSTLFLALKHSIIFYFGSGRNSSFAQRIVSEIDGRVYGYVKSVFPLGPSCFFF